MIMKVKSLGKFLSLKALPIFLTLAVLSPLCCWAREGMQALPVPTTVTPGLQKYITSTPLSSIWNVSPQSAEEWTKCVQSVAEADKPRVAALLEKMQVKLEKAQLSGVPIFVLTPKEIAPSHEQKVLLHIHGGGYVFNPGETGTPEGILMASFGKFKVISVDYRMPPAHPYPAALDDVVTVYTELLKRYPAKNIGVFGSFTGGGLTLALMLRLKSANLPMPAAIAPGSPWSDLDKVGDTYFTNEGQDDILVTYDNWLKGAAHLYANGKSLRNPYISPVYGDVANFPPTHLTSGTRDLFLSNTVRMHMKLLESNVQAELVVFEGMSHILFMIDPDVVEVQFHFKELTKFFDRNFKD